MSKPMLLPVTILFLFTHLAICNGVPVLGRLTSLESSKIDAIASVGDCFEDAQMESEISRRILVGQRRYISYETLKRDMVPCATPGASYYDCHAGQANPYNRGCEIITRCARDIKDINT